MIKFRGSRDGRPVVGLGLSRDNVERLTHDRPIIVDAADLGEPQWGQIVLFFGETEKDMQAELRKHGMIGPDTIVHGMPTDEA
jgi:hypothetical protein